MHQMPASGKYQKKSVIESPRSVKCADNHLNEACKKTRNSLATYATEKTA